jgi:serine/threonine-protein phosphatase 4 regulatory subunit 1
MLTKDGQFKVRRSLAFSLHEVAKILGTQLTESALLPTLEAFLKDLEEVKVGVITHLAKFFEILSPSIREEYLYVLDDIRKDSNWRFRKLLAKFVSFAFYCLLFGIFGYIYLTIAFALGTDNLEN